MTNTLSNRFKKMCGAATLIGAAVLLSIATLTMLVSAKHSRMQSVVASNMVIGESTFSAAEAGMEMGVNYLKENYSTVIANPVNGYIPVYTDPAITNVTMANGATFTVVYTNPIASDYDVIEITSTGTGPDGTTTRTVSQQVYAGSIVMNVPDNPSSMGGDSDMTGNSEVNNAEGEVTLELGGTASLSGSAETTGTGGSSDKHNVGTDVVEGSAAMSGSPGELFAEYFGTDETTIIRDNFQHQYTNSSSTNYSSILNGLNGTSIWIEQTSNSTASLSGNISIGTITSPVVIVVNNGEFMLTGNVDIYGFIFLTGTNSVFDISGNASTVGGVVGVGDLDMSGNASITYDSGLLSILQNLGATTYIAKIPGTWRDY